MLWKLVNFPSPPLMMLPILHAHQDSTSHVPSVLKKCTEWLDPSYHSPFPGRSQPSDSHTHVLVATPVTQMKLKLGYLLETHDYTPLLDI